MAFHSTNPATGERVKEHAEIDATEVGRRLDLADRAFEEWRETPFAARGEMLRRLAALLREKSGELAAIEAAEMGRPVTLCESEIEKSAKCIEYYAAQAERMLATEHVESDGDCSVRYDPLGVILAVMPWNFPYWQVVRGFAPALAAGNTMVLKHASNVQGCAAALESLFPLAGFPTGVFQNLAIRAAAVEPLLRDPRVKGATLTGSEKAGQSVARVCGEEVKPVVLELGGSDPFVVLDDADLDLAADVGVDARLQNSGQSCIAAKRQIVVGTALADAFVAKLKERIAAKVKPGDPADRATTMGPLATESGLREIEAQIADAAEKGATVWRMTMPEGLPAAGYWCAPAIITGVTPEMRVAREETFGPVFTVLVAESENAAIAMANDTPFGLGASLWTRDVVRAKLLAGRIDAGFVGINDMVKSAQELPFGGIKRSGIGRELGVWGLRSFVNVKTVRARA